MDEITLLVSAVTILGAALGSLLMWAFYGLPRVGKQLSNVKEWAEALVVQAMAKSAEEIASRLSEAAPLIVAQATEAFIVKAPELAAAFGPVLQEALSGVGQDLAPIVTEALLARGREVMADKSNASQSFAKAALADVELQAELGKLGPEAGKLLAGLTGGGGNPLLAMVPKKWQPVAQLVLSRLGAGGGAGGNGPASSGSYSPGLPGR